MREVLRTNDRELTFHVLCKNQGPQRVWKVWKVCNLIFQFPDLEKVWKFVKSFGNFKKRFGTFCLLPKKNLEDRMCASRSIERSEAASARLPKAVRVWYRLFTFVPIHRTNCVGQAQSCSPAAIKQKGTLRTVCLSHEPREGTAELRHEFHQTYKRIKRLARQQNIFEKNQRLMKEAFKFRSNSFKYGRKVFSSKSTATPTFSAEQPEAFFLERFADSPFSELPPSPSPEFFCQYIFYKDGQIANRS